MNRYIRIELQELKKHRDHELLVDAGGASFQGEVPRYQYSIWCRTCKDSVGNTIIVKEE